MLGLRLSRAKRALKEWRSGIMEAPLHFLRDCESRWICNCFILSPGVYEKDIAFSDYAYFTLCRS